MKPTNAPTTAAQSNTVATNPNAMPRILDRVGDSTTVVDRGARIAELERELAHERAEAYDDAVRAIARVTAGHVFTVGELVDHQRVDDDLRRALGEAGLHSPYALGKFLQSQAAHPPTVGLVIRKVRRTRDGAEWRVMTASA